MLTIKEEIAKFLGEAVEKASGEVLSPGDVASSFEAPREEKFGDLSTNAALKAAKAAKKVPRVVAEEITRHLGESIKRAGLEARISKIAVEGPGFINFTYSPREIAGVLLKIHEEGENFGRPPLSRKRNILLEFVSANPTGPLTVAHGRQAALGDVLAKILQFCGHRVYKEYYNNDEGVQITILGRSIRSRYLSEIGMAGEFPEDGYKGEYIRDMAKQLAAEHGAKLAGETDVFFARYGREAILGGIKKDLGDFGVVFDHYYSQEALGRSGKIEGVLEELKEKGVVYESEGALWFRSTSFGDDKDRVIVKSDKTHTYLLPDVAYHEDKLKRGFDFLIDILGPDHHGYIPRIKAAVEALGFSKEALEVKIAQLVTLYEEGKTLRMSTRAGEFVTLREVLDEVGKDAGRFFFLMRRFDQHLDFDLALAKSQTMDNPVFYIQYAHARIESVKNHAKEKGIAIDWSNEEVLSLLVDPLEIQVMRLLRQYEETVGAAERTLEPFRLIPYLKDLAAAFHKFYAENRVVTDDAPLTQARLMLVVSVQAILRSGLELLGVSAPTKM